MEQTEQVTDTKTIHHWVVAFDTERKEWYLDGELELDLFSSVNGTILDKETNQFMWAGWTFENRPAVNDNDSLCQSKLQEVLKYLNELMS